VTTELDIQDANGNTITTIELFPDVLERMTLEAAIRGVSIEAHVVGIITDAVKRIAEDTENTE
jgi:hypothetical protein